MKSNFASDIADLDAIEKFARELCEKSKAKNTRKAYRTDWSDFASWCEAHRRRPMPATPDTVVYYLADRSRRLKPSTLQRRLATIAAAHRAAGFESPTRQAKVRMVWQGICREKGVAQSHKAATLTRHLRRMLEALPKNLLGLRDRALLLLGFAGAMRRSELVGLDFSDLGQTEEGLVVVIRRGKTDQSQKGRKIGIPFGGAPFTCPVRAVLEWVEASGIAEGALFRSVNRHGQVSEARLSDRTVARVVKRSLRAAGVDSEKFSGHSLRAGLATAAAMAGASERSIANQTGHKSLAVLRRYIRDGSLFRDNAAAKIGL